MPTGTTPRSTIAVNRTGHPAGPLQVASCPIRRSPSPRDHARVEPIQSGPRDRRPGTAERPRARQQTARGAAKRASLRRRTPARSSPISRRGRRSGAVPISHRRRPGSNTSATPPPNGAAAKHLADRLEVAQGIKHPVALAFATGQAPGPAFQALPGQTRRATRLLLPDAVAKQLVTRGGSSVTRRLARRPSSGSLQATTAGTGDCRIPRRAAQRALELGAAPLDDSTRLATFSAAAA